MAATWLVAVMANLANSDGGSSSSGLLWPPLPPYPPFPLSTPLFLLTFRAQFAGSSRVRVHRFGPALLFLGAVLVLALFCCSLFCVLLATIAPF